MTVTTGLGWRLEVLGEKRWWLVIDDPLTETLQDGEVPRRLGDIELPPGAVVVVSRLHPDDSADLIAGSGVYDDGPLRSGILDRVKAQLVGDGLVGDGLVEDLRLALRNDHMLEYSPVFYREPIERPWLDQRLCRPRKLKRWRGKR